MPMIRTAPRSPRSQRGQMLVVSAVGMVVFLGLIGLVVDVGRLYVVRQQLRNACDAAAAAGAAFLPIDPDYSRSQAFRYYCINAGGTPPADPITDETLYPIDGIADRAKVTTPLDGEERSIRVEAWRTVPSTFMRVLGIASTEVFAFAVGTNRGQKLASAMLASSYSGGRSQPLDRLRPDGKRYAVVIEGNNLKLGVDANGNVVAPICSAQNVYIDTNNSNGGAVYGDESNPNYTKGNDKTDEGLLNPVLAAVGGSVILDPNYYLDEATEDNQVYTGSVTIQKRTVDGFFFVYGDLTLGKNVSGTATFAATGKITINESKNDLTRADTAYNILFYAGCDPTLDPATYFDSGNPAFNPDAHSITMNDNNSTYYGTLYAPYGYIVSSSNQTTIVGALVADGLAITKNKLTLLFDPAFCPALAPGSGLTQ